jgi:hypothetical protein
MLDIPNAVQACFLQLKKDQIGTGARDNCHSGIGGNTHQQDVIK